MATALLLLFSYVLGSVPVGFLLGARAGIDVRRAGSGNIGATNVARVMGWQSGLVTFLGDVAKGLVPVILALQLDFGVTGGVLSGLGAFFGHLYPVFLKFQGGKGVATALGVLLALAPLATSLLALVFAASAAASRTVSVSSLSAAAAAPLLLWLLSYPPPVVAVGFVIAMMIFIRHRENIRRLMRGIEPRFTLPGR